MSFPVSEGTAPHVREPDTSQGPFSPGLHPLGGAARHVQQAASCPPPQLATASWGPGVSAEKAPGLYTSQLALLRLPTAESGFPERQDRQDVCTCLDTMHLKEPATRRQGLAGVTSTGRETRGIADVAARVPRSSGGRPLSLCGNLCLVS